MMCIYIYIYTRLHKLAALRLLQLGPNMFGSCEEGTDAAGTPEIPLAGLGQVLKNQRNCDSNDWAYIDQ